MVPKIIHQTYKTEQIPEKWKISHSEWKNKHPSAQYMFWTDEDNRKFVEENFPDYLETFDNFPYPIQRADAIRYMLLYKFGGVYSDLDIVPNEDVFPYLESGKVFLMKSANSSKTTTNMFMASIPKQEFWLEVLEATKCCLPFYAVGKHLKVMMSTGPLMLSSVVEKTKSVITYLPTCLFNPSDISDVDSGKSGERRDTVLRIIEGSSWHSFDSRMFNFFFKYGVIFIGILSAIATIVLFLMIRWTHSYFWMTKNCEFYCPLKSKGSGRKILERVKGNSEEKGRK